MSPVSHPRPSQERGPTELEEGTLDLRPDCATGQRLHPGGTDATDKDVITYDSHDGARERMVEGVYPDSYVRHKASKAAQPLDRYM